MSNNKSVLNVGGNSKAIALPNHFKNHQHILLDIDPTGEPDVVCDARELQTLHPGQYDAVYCSHNLEHYFAHDVKKVLSGFHHILKDDGFVQIRVPDLMLVMRRCMDDRLDLNDALYQSGLGPISVLDVIYGYGEQIERSGKDFFAHKTGFSENTLKKSLENAGFPSVFRINDPVQTLEINVIAFKAARSVDQVMHVLNPQ